MSADRVEDGTGDAFPDDPTDPPPDGPPDGPPDDAPAPTPPTPEIPWQRLDPRMLLVHPVREVGRFLPVLVIVVIAGSSRGGSPWQLAALVAPVLLGLVRYLSTRFRIADGRVELRSGLLVRRARTTPVDRVRTVDLSATLVHRVVGLSTVQIGTGTGDDDQRLEIDALRVRAAERLRDDLLQAARGTASDPGPPAGEGSATPDDPAGNTPAPASPPVLVLDPRWARYAPLTSTGVVVLAGVLAAGGQVLNGVGAVDRLDAEALARGTEGVTLGVVEVLVGATLLGALALTAVLAVAGYLIGNWRFTLRHTDGSWHLRRGLLTTRETTIDDDRMAGVLLHRPLSLRLARAARLTAVVTGLRSDQPGSALLVPPAPRQAVVDAAAAVVGSSQPLRATLQPHGPAATRRRFTRALLPALVLAALPTGLVVAGWSAGWLVAAAVVVGGALLLAADRARALGHAHVDGHVVARSGSVVRRREVLADRHVIGWNARATWFQRRVGLVTLSATTAGGPQQVTIPDVPEDRAVGLAAAVLPEVVHQFLDDPTPAGTAPGGTPVAAPFRGVLTLLVGEGEEVEAGQRLAVVEAMKLEAAVTAPRAGTLVRVAAEDGATVDGGDLLVVLA